MRAAVRVVHDLVTGIEPGDQLEAEHQDMVLNWLENTDDIFRRAKPATPVRHLVSYVVVVDPEDDSILLVDHIKAGLWLPPGGHVEPDEHPADAAGREAREELGIDPSFVQASRQPLFITVTRTVGRDTHTDVSLWFLLVGHRSMALVPDCGEFTASRWWSETDVRAAIPGRFDPHYQRFLTKLRATQESRSAS